MHTTTFLHDHIAGIIISGLIIVFGLSVFIPMHLDRSARQKWQDENDEHERNYHDDPDYYYPDEEPLN